MTDEYTPPSLDAFFERILDARKVLAPYINRTIIDHSTTFRFVNIFMFLYIYKKYAYNISIFVARLEMIDVTNAMCAVLYSLSANFPLEQLLLDQRLGKFIFFFAANLLGVMCT